MTTKDELVTMFENEEITTVRGITKDELEDYLNDDDYQIMTDDEADETCKEYIEQSLWAFNASFLSYETDLPIEVYEALQGQCESSNEAVAALVEKTCGIDSLVDSAISADGRGHFLSSYDGQELEVSINGVNYYIYRN